MKIRNGFVSNSSSSSFIVAVDKGQRGKFTLTLEVDLEKYLERRLSSLEDLGKYIKEWNKENYEQIKSEIEKGRDILVGSFASDNDDAVEVLLCESGIPKDVEGITIIENEADY
jgi:hypothetical protein